MLKKPDLWDSTEAVIYGDYEPLKLGGHVCIIKDASEYTSQNYTTSLRICVDVIDDEQAGYFQKQYENNTLSEAKWPNGAIKYVSLKEDANCVAMYKGFITCVEKSNPGFKWNFNEKDLIGKKIGGVFGLEEYVKQNGDVGTATKLVQFRSIDKVKDAKIPKIKGLDGSYFDYEPSKKDGINNSSSPSSITDENWKSLEESMSFEL